jgi:glycosyltransferase involved in cell wall biosynthesis
MTGGKLLKKGNSKNSIFKPIINAFPGIEIKDFYHNELLKDQVKKVDLFLLTPLHLRIGIIYNKNTEIIDKAMSNNYDYILYPDYNSNNAVYKEGKVFYRYTTEKQLIDIIKGFEDKKRFEVEKAKKRPYCSIIISTYNSKDLLRLTLEAYTLQKYRNFEIIIADDGSSDGTDKMVKEYCDFFYIQYCWQEDRGFRKAKILNKALSKARGQYIIMTDHDAIPGPDFVLQHIKEHHEGLVLLGGRKCIPPENQYQLSINRILINNNSLKKLASLQWFYQKKLRKISLVDNPYFYALGVNISMHKIHFMEVGGYDESLVGYGDEDIDIARRLYQNGIRFKGLLNSNLFHVEHPLRRNFYYLVKKENKIQVKIKQVIKASGFSSKKCTLIWSYNNWQPGSINRTELRFDQRTLAFYGSLVLPNNTKKLLFKMQFITLFDEVVWNDNNGCSWSWDLIDDYVYHDMPESVEERNDCGTDTIYIPDIINHDTC